MFERFSDYMYYLLSTPFKKVHKLKNQWYLFFKVVGKLFDRNKEILFQIREESMIATCSDEMLSVHAEDRGLTRYDGESNDNFRRRIALYEEVCRLGGTQNGMKKAVEALGYRNVEIVPFRMYNSARWAEFYVEILQTIDEEKPIADVILKKVVRKTKSSSAKDNYIFNYRISTVTRESLETRIILPIAFFQFEGIKILDGSFILDASQYLNAAINLGNMQTGYKMSFENKEETTLKMISYKNIWYLNGLYLLDGSNKLNAEKREEIYE